MSETRDAARGARRPAFGEPEAPDIADWLHVERDGTVTVFTGKAEVGQNIRTSLAQAVAEELRVPAARVRLVMADTELTPFDMGTFGSLTTPVMAARLHKVAAAAREVLLEMAADWWGVERAELHFDDGRITHPPSGRAIGIGDITQGRRLTGTYDDNAPVTPASEWRVAGAALPNVDARAVVTGRRRYTPDLARPDMLTGKVLRPPAFGATLTALDTRAAEAMPGVVVVHEGNFAGVAAPNRMLALRAIEAIRAEWSVPPTISARELFAHLRAHPAEPQGYQRFAEVTDEAIGSLDEGRAAADHTLAATYTVAYIAHAPLEPRAALAEWDEDRLTVWTGTQRPFGVRAELAEVFGLPEERIRVIVPDTGAAYGGKHLGDAAIEAARLARAARKPVKLVWTREEEFTWAYFRPAGVIDVSSGVRADGTLTAWEHVNFNSGSAAIRPPYAIPNVRVRFQPAQSPLRQGSYRALAATANHFARETHIDEIAHALGMDPLELRLRNLRDPRLIAVFRAAAERFGWGRARPAEGHGFGIAGGTEKGSHVAACAEVAVDPGTRQLRVVRVVEAFECGAIVNPEGLRNQVEGAIIQGLGGALFEAIDFSDGKVLTDRFSAYRVPRFGDVPDIEMVLLDRKDLPSAGAGETPIVGIAPAVGNAIFAATGVRLRGMPLVPGGIAPQCPATSTN